MRTWVEHVMGTAISIAVAADDAETVGDAYDTAAVAMGDLATTWLPGLGGYEALLVDAAGGVWWTEGFPLD